MIDAIGGSLGLMVSLQKKKKKKKQASSSPAANPKNKSNKHATVYRYLALNDPMISPVHAAWPAGPSWRWSPS